MVKIISYTRLGEVIVLPNVQKPTQTVKVNKETKEYVPSKKDKINL